MKKLFLIMLLGVFLSGCGASTQRVSKEPIPEGKTKTEGKRESESLIAHSNDPQTKTLPKVEKSAEKKKWTRSGNPIETSEFDAEIAQAEKFLKTKPNDAAAKNAVSQAYYKRGFALTQARQYASAIGDYRRVLKYDPENADAKKWIATIINIYKSINREAPGEGEEPPPLEFNKDKA